MSQGTNTERITQNNAIINDNNTDLDTIRTKMAEVFEPVNLQSKEVTITENGTTTIEPDEGYDGLSDVDVTVATSGADLSEYFTDTISGGSQYLPSVVKIIKKISMMTVNGTSMNYMFYKCSELEEIPLIDISNVTSALYAFNGCTSLKELPLLDTSKITQAPSIFGGCTSLVSVPALDFSRCTELTDLFGGCTSLVNIGVLKFPYRTTLYRSIFRDCPNLSNESLNNILYSLATYMNGVDSKTLSIIGLSQEQAEICTTLSNWQLCVDAGWTTGY